MRRYDLTDFEWRVLNGIFWVLRSGAPGHDLLECGIDICHETVRLWWNGFGPLISSEIRRQRVSRMRGFHHWR